MNRNDHSKYYESKAIDTSSTRDLTLNYVTQCITMEISVSLDCKFKIWLVDATCKKKYLQNKKCFLKGQI